MTPEEQTRIDAINLLVENGCNGLSCKDCPVATDKLTSKEHALCHAIEEFNK